jgi:selenocysteine lyase/cysteine desulfurase
VAEIGAESLLGGEFELTKSVTYLNTAAEGLLPASSARRLTHYGELKQRGMLSRPQMVAMEESARAAAGAVFGVDARDVAFLASTARGLDAVVKSIDWEPGDNIVLMETEFPTSAFTAVSLGAAGVQRRVVPTREGVIHLTDVAEHVDGRTRLVVASLVSFKTGQRLDVGRLATIAHSRGSLLFIDAIQAAGAVPLRAAEADFICAAAFKWQLGMHGIATLYVNPATAGRLSVPYVGYRGVVDIFPADRFDHFELWPDARRYEEGMPSYGGMFVLEQSLSLVSEVGLGRIEEHVLTLSGAVLESLATLGIEPLTPTAAADRAGIVSFESSAPESLIASLETSGIHGWGRDGRVRFSLHLYNSLNDVDRLHEALVHAMRKR